MKKIVIVFLSALLFLTACTSQVDLETERHALVFEQDVIPQDLLEILAANKIIHVGEYHNNDAHAKFLTELVLELETHNLLLIEMAHALEWIVEDYTMGKLESMPAFMAQFTQVDFRAIRAYNQEAHDEEKIHVKTIDINHAPQFLAVSIRAMIDLGYIEATTPIKAYLENHAEEEDVLKLQKHLLLESDSLRSKWGDKSYDRVNHMVERELQSIYCRKPLETGDVALRTKRRETVMKETVEKIISLYAEPVIINTGFNHTQKNHYLGTEQEWLGEYLEFVSPHGKGKTYHLVVVPIEGAINWSDDGTVKRQTSIFDYTGSGELFKSMGNISSGRSVFLDFRSSDFFASERMKMNFHYEIIELIPYHMFDGVLLLSQFVEVEQEKE